MDLVSTARIVRRRWYAAVVGVVCTLIGTAVVLTMAPTYEATSVLVLLAPNTPSAATTTPGAAPAPVNPYQAFDSSITITADLMSTQVMQPRVVDELVRRGASPDYTVATDPDTGGPTVTITAEAATGQQAVATTRLVSAEFRRQLTERQAQAGAPRSSLITASPVVTPTSADRLVSGRIRALVAVLGVGMVLSIGLALVAEAVALGLERRRTRRAPPAPSAHDATIPSTVESLEPEPVGARVSEAGPLR
jgi:capsular polysaccharide biosynthesis protein